MAELNEEQLLRILGFEKRPQVQNIPQLPILLSDSVDKKNALYIPYSVSLADMCDRIFAKYGFKFPASMEIKIKVPNILRELIDFSWNHRDSKFTYNFRCYYPFRKTYYGGHYSITYTIKENLSVLYNSYPPMDLKSCIKYCNVYNQNFRVTDDLNSLNSYLSELKPAVQRFVSNIDNLYKS